MWDVQGLTNRVNRALPKRRVEKSEIGKAVVEDVDSQRQRPG